MMIFVVKKRITKCKKWWINNPNHAKMKNQHFSHAKDVAGPHVIVSNLFRQPKMKVIPNIS
jgi:hypothetical protein